MSRPEHFAPPEVFYNEAEAQKYLVSSRMVTMQTQMAERCLELLGLSKGGDRGRRAGASKDSDDQYGDHQGHSESDDEDDEDDGEDGDDDEGSNQEEEEEDGDGDGQGSEHHQVRANEAPKLLLDIGCGTGLSGDVLSEHGHIWVGMDISHAMLQVALARDVEGDLFLSDAGQGLYFRTGVFDGAISVSVLQWLCNADTSQANPRKRLQVFFESLYSCLKRGSRAVFQFYPENTDQMELITASAMRAGFSGGIVVDYPNSSKAKKIYLVLNAGPPLPDHEQPKALGVEERNANPKQVKYSGKRERPQKKRKNRTSTMSIFANAHSTKDKVIAVKDRQRRQGKEVRVDSKYTGRKRSKKF